MKKLSIPILLIVFIAGLSGSTAGEYLTTSAPPSSLSTVWYMPHVDTVGNNHAYLDIFNPNDEITSVIITYFYENGATTNFNTVLYPQSCDSINLKTIQNIFGMKIESNKPVVVQVMQYYQSDKNSRSEVINGVPELRTTHYLFGITKNGINNGYLYVFNPNPGESANIDVSTYAGGKIYHNSAPMVVGAYRHASIPFSSVVEEYINDLNDSDSIGLKLLSSVPVAVYQTYYSYYLNSMMGTMSTYSLEKSTYLIGIHTLKSNPDDRAVINILNPSYEDIPLIFMTLFPSSGKVMHYQDKIGKLAHKSILINDYVGEDIYGIQIESSKPLLINTAQFFGSSKQSATINPVSAPSRVFYIPGVHFENNQHNSIETLNPNSNRAAVNIRYSSKEGKLSDETVYLEPKSFKDIPLNQSINYSGVVCAAIESDRPIIVQHIESTSTYDLENLKKSEEPVVKTGTGGISLPTIPMSSLLLVVIVIIIIAGVYVVMKKRSGEGIEF